jgi:hypothetical protein
LGGPAVNMITRKAQLSVEAQMPAFQYIMRCLGFSVYAFSKGKL